MIITLIIFLIFVLPVIKQRYSIDKGEFPIVKGINFLSTFLVFSYFIDIFRENILWLKNDYSCFYDSLYTQIGTIGPQLNMIGYFLFIICSIFMSVIMIRLAIRDRKAYKLLPYFIPLTWGAQVLYFNFKYFAILQDEIKRPLGIEFIIYLAILLGLMWGLVVSFFYNRKVKRFFYNPISKG